MNTQEDGKLELELLGRLRELSEEPMTVKTRQRVLMAVDRMLSNLRASPSQARDDDYMSEVLAMRPDWQRKVTTLKGANNACAAALNELSHRISHELALAATDQTVARKLSEWIESLDVLRGQEVRLHQCAYIVDLGGES